VDQERVADEDVARRPGREHRMAARARLGRRRRRLQPVQPVVPGRRQHAGGVQVRPRTDPGRRAGVVDVAQQVEHQQPAGPGIDVDLLVPVALVAGLNMPARVPGVGQAGEAHRDRAADTGPAPPAPGPDQLIERLPQGRPGAGLGERAALGAGDAHHRRCPGARLVGHHPVPAEFRPDHPLTAAHDVGRHGAPDGDVPVGDEGLHLAAAEHGDRIASPLVMPPLNKRATVTASVPGPSRPGPAGTGPPAA
jgi:hypothetical protein